MKVLAHVLKVRTDMNWSKILHATELQTVIKLIESQVNNISLGYGFGLDGDNSPGLRIITPYMLRHGRSNLQDLDGPIELSDGYDRMMDKVEQTYKAWYKIWHDKSAKVV